MADKIRLLIHAPTPGALERARRNAVNLRKAAPDAEVEIVANAGAVAHALAQPDASDAWLVLCGNTLAATGAVASPELRVVPAAVLHLAERQLQGWQYMRA
jgi:NitT/TauT family transport system ATP-binding protein